MAIFTWLIDFVNSLIDLWNWLNEPIFDINGLNVTPIGLVSISLIGTILIVKVVKLFI